MVGALKNVELAKQLFPDYLCYFFTDNTVPQAYLDLLSKNENTKIINMSASSIPPLMWRFTAIDLPEVEVMLSRDADSRLNKREKITVDAWLSEHTDFMIIKDHPYFHTNVKMFGGMWAMKKVKNFNIQQHINQWIKRTKHTDITSYGIDQFFLDEVVYPLSLNSLSYYDNYNINQLACCKKIPYKRKNWRFIGEIFNEDGTRAYHWKSLRGYHIRQYGFLGYCVTKVLNLFNPEWR